MAGKLIKKKKVVELTKYVIDRIVVARDGRILVVNYTEGTTRIGPKGKKHYRPLLGDERRLYDPAIEPPLDDMDEMTAEEIKAAQTLVALIKKRLDADYQEEGQ